jgi:hypothetical protein
MDDPATDTARIVQPLEAVRDALDPSERFDP